MLTQVEISHYKSLTDVKLRLGPVNIIVGPNGSGKSNLIDALCFLHDCLDEDIDSAVTKRHGIDSIRQWSKTKPYHVIIAASFDGRLGHGAYRIILSSTKGDYRIIEEAAEWVMPATSQDSDRDAAKDVRSSSFLRLESGSVVVKSNYSVQPVEPVADIPSSELFLTSLRFRTTNPHLIPFRYLQAELAAFSTYSIYPNTLRLPQVISRDKILNEDGSNLATVLRSINSGNRNRRTKDDLLSALQVVMPIASDILIRSAGGYYVPVIRVKEVMTGDTHDFNLSQISDGTLRVLGLITAFYQPAMWGKIAVEEPEQMIHPGALPIIAEAARDFAAREQELPIYPANQVFITTHSPTLLDLFRPEEIIWAKFNNGATDCAHISTRQLDLIKQQLFSAGEILLTEGFFS